MCLKITNVAIRNFESSHRFYHPDYIVSLMYLSPYVLKTSAYSRVFPRLWTKLPSGFRRVSAPLPERSENVGFTDDGCPFHSSFFKGLCFSVKMLLRIGIWWHTGCKLDEVDDSITGFGKSTRFFSAMSFDRWSESRFDNYEEKWIRIR